MKKLVITFIFSVVIITMNSCKNTSKSDNKNGDGIVETSAPKHEDWETLDNVEYSMSYPKNWIIDTSGKDGVEYMISSPSDGEKDRFTQNISLVTEGLDNSTDLDAYSVAAVEQLVNAFTESSPKREKIKLNNQDCSTVTFEAKGYKFQQYYFVKNNKAYVIGFTTGENDFDKDIVLAQKIMNTFKLK